MWIKVNTTTSKQGLESLQMVDETSYVMAKEMRLLKTDEVVVVA
jgi:hypothetical protein